MTEDRFRHLAAAFGADLDRWPESERAAAAAFLSREPTAAQGALAPERRLDETLASYAASEPRYELRERIIAAAPRQRAVGRTLRWLAGAGLGLGLAVSCAAGVATGFSFAPQSVTHMFAQPPSGGPDVSSLADPADDPADG
jgi:hypothetical protein